VTDEITQAAIYGELLRGAACDPDVAEISFFGFRDDTLRTGFQAALQRADGSVRPAAQAVREAIEETGTGCTGRIVRWRPGTGVLGARVAIGAVGSSRVATRIVTGEDARAVVCVRAAASMLVSAGRARCRTASVAGLRPRSLQVLAPTSARGAVRVAVRLAAESNRKRTTTVVGKAALRR
jgi:hypothetical protein